MNAQTRKLVSTRANGRCEYCRLPTWADPYEAFHVEHIVAKQHGGSDDLDNLAWSCSRCNRRKGTNLASADAEIGAAVDLFHPRRQSWNDHFALRHGHIRGLTPAGRATVRLLNFNASHRVELRREMVEDGWLIWEP